MSEEIYVVTGATGHIGRVLSEELLRNGHSLRVIGRSKERLQPLVDLGAQAFVGSLEDASFLAEAFRGAKAVFAMIPPSFAAENFRKYQGRISDSLIEGIMKSGVSHVVALSSLGAHLPTGTGPIKGLFDFEQKLEKLNGVSILILRPSLFMENLLDAVPVINTMGVNGSALRPDVEVAMIATRDIAIFAANAMVEASFTGVAAQVLLGPADQTMTKVTRSIGRAIGNNDLQYVQFPYENVKEALLGAGASENLADEVIEMNQWLNSNGMANLKRTGVSTTPTTVDDFVQVFQSSLTGAEAQAVH
jgi:uncharacterized protein YbjT (DUF2867 family)